MPAPSDPSRHPVLVGAATAVADADALDLMVRAAEACGSTALLAAVERVVVPRGTWAYDDPGRAVGAAIGAPTARTYLVDLGIPQQTLINEVMAAIMAGEIDVALVVGAESKARDARIAKGSGAANAAGMASMLRSRGTATPDVHQVPKGEIISQPEIEAGLWAPVEQYALIESALRHAEGVPVDARRRDVAALYARFNDVAQHNPEAAFPAPMSADALVELGPNNRPLAFPYGKWHASQWTVDQGAALLLCSVEAAEKFGVPRDEWVFPLVGLDSSHALALTKRRAMAAWPAMGVLGRAAVERIGRPLASCEHVEVYSCFPAAVRVQQRELGLPLDGTPTITGGMSFAGGPFNSFVLQATATMAQRLRVHGGAGLVTTVSGLLTKPGLAVWSAEPDGQAPLVADLAADAATATATIEVVSSYEGAAVIAAYTVTYDGYDPKELIAIVDTTDKTRAIVRSTDPDLVARATSEELIGHTFKVEANTLLS